MNATLEELRQAVAFACAETDANPSEAQALSGNYRKGKVRLFGLNISIETPKGAVRQGKTADGKRWAVVMPVPYGYILQTESEADGDHLDVFIGPDLDSEVVFVVDQNKPDSVRFDEHKIMLGFRNEAEARQTYLASFTGGYGSKIFRSITPMTLPVFRQWVTSGDTKTPISDRKVQRYAMDRDPTRPGSDGIQHRVGDMQTINGKQYRFNEHSRWELANKEQAQGEPKQASAVKPALPPKEQLDAAAKKATANIHPTMKGVIEGIHADPDYAESGAKHETGLDSKTAKLAYGFLQANLRKGSAGGGEIRNLGNGKLGFASAAGALAITPDGRAEYTVHTQTVADAAIGKQPPSDDDEIELELADDQPEPKPAEPAQEYRNDIPIAKALSPLQDAEFHRNRTKAAHAQALANLDYQKYMVSHHRATGNKAGLMQAKEAAALAEYQERVARREHREAKQHHEKTIAASQKQAAKIKPPPVAPNPAAKAPSSPASKATGPKPPHELTRKEFEASGQKATDHKAHIKSALKGGKRIPLNVLKDYPELIAEYARVSDTPKPAEARTAAEGETLVTPPPAPKTAGLSEEDKEQLRKLGFTDAHIEQMTVKPKSTVIPAEDLQPKPKAPRKSKSKATAPAQTPVQDSVFQDANGVRRFLPSSEFRDVPKGTLLPPGVETTINTATGKTQARWHPKTPKATVDAFHKRHGIPIQRYSDDTSTERWITIGASEDGDGEKHGGTPVKIDGKGKITAGPNKLAGKSLDNLPPREPSKEEGDGSSEPQEDTPRNSRLEKHRKALVEALREKFGDEAETLADEIGLTSHPRFHLQYNKKLPEAEARSLADKIDQAWRDTHKDLIEAERFDDVDWQPLKRFHELTDEEKQKNKEEFDKQREVEKAWADKNWKKPPAILETTPKQWAAIAARKQKASLEKDQKRLQALKAIEDEMMGLWGDTSEEGRARSKELATEFDAQMETKGVKMLLNRYRPGWMDRKTKPTVRTALEEAEDNLDRVTRDIDGHYFNDTSIPAIKDHANAVKEALEKGEKVSDELLQHYRYEDWVPRTAHERLFTIDAQKEFDKYHVSPSHKLRIAAVDEGVSKVRPLISALKAEYPSEYLSAHKKMERLRQEMNAAWTRHFDLTAKRAAERGENPVLTQEVADELDKAWYDGDRASRAYNEARKEADELRQSHGREWIKPLLPKKTAQVEFVGGEHLSEASRQKMEEAKHFLSSVLHENWGKIEVKVNPLDSGVAGGDIYAKNGRAYASAGSIYMPVESAARVFIHETGHVVEHIRGQVLGALSSAFAVKQLADHQQKPEHLGSGYEPGEVGAQNGFMNSYVGKWYGRDSSEILSMGLEYLAADPIRFSQESPEHFEYVIAAINGHLI